MTRAYGLIVLMALTSALAATQTRAQGEPASNRVEAIRGGWVADADGVRHVFILKVRDPVVSGIYCPVDCTDPANLQFIDHGMLTPDGLRFQVLRIEGTTQSRTDVVGHLADGRLSLTLTPQGKSTSGPTQLTAQRDPRKPKLVTVEELFARRGVTSGPLVISGSTTPYVPPGPNERIEPATLEGLWVWGTGPNKQHFIFRRVGDRMLGVACGPCDNPYSFGALDNVAIHGDSVTFDINHEDWGIGIEFGAFVNHATATISHHELHLQTVQHNGPRTIQGDMVLAGPLRMTPR